VGFFPGPTQNLTVPRDFSLARITYGPWNELGPLFWRGTQHNR
jgi:hypothetical protein